MTPLTAISAAFLSDRGAVDRVPSVEPRRSSVPPQPVIGGNVLVEFDRHATTGAQVVRFIDKRTGETINQLPAQQVLDAVSALMDMLRKQEA